MMNWNDDGYLPDVASLSPTLSGWQVSDSCLNANPICFFVAVYSIPNSA